MRSTAVVAVAVVCLLASGLSRSSTPRTAQVVEIRLHQAFISPGKSTGGHWDGLGRVKQTTEDALNRLLEGKLPFKALFSLIRRTFSKGFSRPDAFGTLTLRHKKGQWSRRLPLRRDTHAPMWGEGFKTKIADGMTITLRLFDADLRHHDPIGTVMLSAKDLRKALAAEKVVPIAVHEQSPFPTILFVTITVVAVE